jgi:hypothetical protein
VRSIGFSCVGGTVTSEGTVVPGAYCGLPIVGGTTLDGVPYSTAVPPPTPESQQLEGRLKMRLVVRRRKPQGLQPLLNGPD